MTTILSVTDQFGEVYSDPDEFLRETFEFERCAECSGDAQHHRAILVLGNWFALCLHEPADDGTPHPIVAKFIAEEC